VTEQRAGFGRRHRALKWALAVLLLLLAALGIALAIGLRRAEPLLRARIVAELERRFHARVELDSFHLSLVDGLWAEGKGLRIWPAANLATAAVSSATSSAAPTPMIRLDSFRFHAPLHYAPGKPLQISVVELEGLTIDVPPKPQFARAATRAVFANGAEKSPLAASLLRFEIATIECKNAHLTLESSHPGKPPLEFAIARFKLTGVNAAGPMQFDAELTNPRPTGTILTSGRFGPWSVEDPGQTPLTGSYRLDHADLADFKGIDGILNSNGSYQGALREMTVDGTTHTPDFRLTRYGTALPLDTAFHARVDGTNGDTWLDRVEATLGHSHFIASGQIVRLPATAQPSGREIALAVNVDRGRIEDFLRLASHGETPILLGELALKTSLDIPPGTAAVSERMKLNGSFVLSGATFTSPKIQDAIAQLSARGQGQPRQAKIADPGAVQSSIQSSFQMNSGVITLPDLQYTVPGAEIDLSGAYTLAGGGLNFAGKAKTQARVSQMVGGWKGMLLKPVDHYFEKDGAGAEVPIHIDGTTSNPHFGIDIGRGKHTSPELPQAQ
jgi:hypothetical protein